MGQIRLSIESNAGGVGKSTIASQIAYLLSLHGKKVALFDLDTSASLNVFAGLEPASEQSSILKVFSDDFNGEWPLVPIWGNSLVDICQGHSDLERVSYSLVTRPLGEIYLSNLLEDYLLPHDFLIFDCPGTRGLMNLNALSASTHLIFVVEPEMKSIAGVSDMVGWYLNTSRMLRLKPKPELLGLLPSKVSFSGFAAHARSLSDLTKFGEQEEITVFKGIRHSKEFVNASEYGLPLRKHRPGHPANDDFEPIVRKLIELQEV